MGRVLLFTYQGDESLVKRIQGFLTDHGYHIISVETAHCASFNLQDRRIDSLFLIEPPGHTEYVTDKVLELKHNRCFVAITAVVSEYFRQQLNSHFPHIFEAFRVQEDPENNCRLQLKPLLLKNQGLK